MITVCLVGCGGHAHRVYADSLRKYAREIGGVTLAACCDVDAKKAESFREIAGFARCYTDYHKMLEQEKPDAVILVTSYEYTAQIAVDVIAHGAAIMLEKPPGKDIAECMAIAEAVARHKPINMVAFNRRSAPFTRQIMDILYGETPLHVQHIDYQMYRSGRGEAHFHTTAIHGVDMIGYIAQSTYGSLNLLYAPLSHYGEGAGNLLLHGRFKNGITTQQSYCPLAGAIMERMIIAADGVTISAETPIWHGPDYPGVIRVYRHGELTQTISGADLCGQELFETDGFYDQLLEFIDCVKNGEPTAKDIISAMDAVKIADCLAARETEYRG